MRIITRRALVWSAAGAAGLIGAVLTIRRRTHEVEATAVERGGRLSGDELIAAPLGSLTHAITIEASPRDVWPWVAQMGAGRGGWYSYDRLDNGGQSSATRIVPEFQQVTHGMIARVIPRIRTEPRLRQAIWVTAVSAMAFVVPLAFSSWLELQHDVYYLVYFATVAAVLAIYVRANDINVTEVVARGWKLSVVLGFLSGAFVTWSVFGRLDGTPHPSGAYFAFEILWRGVVYGIVDALLLSAFPGLIAWELMQRNIAGAGRRTSYAVLTLALVGIITATYHAGYKDLQNVAGISQPEIGNIIISLPVMASVNPAGSVLAHVSMHLAAVTHAYESKDRLPPQVFVGSRK